MTDETRARGRAAGDPVRAMRRVAWAAPALLLGLLVLIAGLRAAVLGAPFAVRFEPGMTLSMSGLGIVLTTCARICRNEAESRAVRSLSLTTLGGLIVVAIGVKLLGGGTWGSVAGFALATLAIGLFAMILAHGQWLARGQA